MTVYTRTIVAGVLLAAVSSIASAAHPQYLIPRSTPVVVPSTQVPEPKRTGQILDAQPYAYGWFGVQPRRHWTRHFGYYRNYTEWSAK